MYASDARLRAILRHSRDASVVDDDEWADALELLEGRERHLRLALGAAGISVWDIDLRSGAARVSSPSPDALPVPGGHLDTTLEHMVAVIHPDDRHLFRRVLEDHRASGEFDFDCRIRPLRSTQTRWAHVKGLVLRDDSGAPERIAGITVDTDDRRRAEIARGEAAEAFRRTIAASNDAFVGLDHEGRVVEWNPAAEQLFGRPAGDAIGAAFVDLAVPSRSRAFLSSAIERLVCRVKEAGSVGDGFGPFQVQVCHRSGRELVVEVSGACVAQGGEVLVHAFLRDVTARDLVVQQLEAGLLTDPLTSLPNRALLNDRLSSALARGDRSSGMVAVMFLDLDRFKVVNDALGHEAGDALLVTIAGRIRRALRPEDTVARFGGDEFVLVIEGIEAVEDLLAMADRIVGEIERPVLVRDHQFHLGASIGISLATGPEADATSLIRDADLAMYRAKRRGGCTYELFDDDMRRAVVTRLELESDLRRALEHDELEVYYQPIVQLDGTIAGAEALVRWHHPTRGLVSPADFIPVAEETGLITAIGTHVLEQAAATVACWRRNEPELYVSVNLSVRQLTDRALPDVVDGILDRSGLEPEALCLELTETALMQDASMAGSTLHRLRERGVTLAVDDFGTGYSSLLYLRRFPVQVLKLDRYFVAGVADEDEDRVIVGSIIEMAHALGLKAVAEGVEREDQRRVLAELGCDYAQGHLFGRAAPSSVLERIIQGREGLIVASEPAIEGPGARPAARPTSGRRPYRAFLVDDSAGDRSLLRATLEWSGEFIVVGEAECADEALARVAGVQPDVVLVDLFLPGADGFELLESLGRVAPAAKPVIVSGFVSDGVSVAAHAAGALACLDKSMSSTSLVDALTSLLAGMRQAATG